ncbi:hypothetical protein ACFM35_04395 [Microbacterium sp. P01]|uniref:hypothetical protein n=1 Tax=unclassified Microbacterium TaxID=2609290 RepID=UPI00366B7932
MTDQAVERGLGRCAGHRAALSSVAVSVLAVALTACAPLGAPAPVQSATAGELPAGIDVELYQLRSDVADRGAQVRIVNDSADDLVVSRITFVDDWFIAPSVRERTSMIAAGRTVDLRIALAESACDDEPDAADRTSRVTVEFTVGGTAPGPSRAATVDVADPLGFTELVHEKECLRHDLAQLAVLKWASFTASEPPAPARLELAVTSADDGGGTGQLTRIETTNLLQFGDLPAPFPLGIALPLDDGETRLTVPLLPLRCDPHAVMEDKRGSVFNVGVEVDGISGVVEVAASEQIRGEILRWVSEWCGFGPGQG